MSTEVNWVSEYATQKILDKHFNWHKTNMRSMNSINRSSNYGLKFLTFHRKFIGKFDTWRKKKNLPLLVPWDPSTPIPNGLPHTPRDTNNPYSVEPRVARPSWLTTQGGFVRDSLYGYKMLSQFRTAAELGNTIDYMHYAMISGGMASWHALVHSTIGGDMASPATAPKDPIFWRWHKFVDNIYAEWLNLH